MQMNLKETSSPITLMKECRGYSFLYLSKSVEFFQYGCNVSNPLCKNIIQY